MITGSAELSTARPRSKRSLMSHMLLPLHRRHFLAGLTVASTLGVSPVKLGKVSGDHGGIRHQAGVPRDEVGQLPCTAATQWPNRLTVGDRAQAAQLEKLQQLIRHWEATMAAQARSQA